MTSKRVNFHCSALRDIAFCDETFHMITEEIGFINNSRNMIFARLKLQKKAQNPPGKLDNITVHMHRNAKLVVDAPIMAHVLTLKY